MRTVRLGRTGLKVSEICLGTMTFGLQTERDEAFAIMDVAEAGGIDFIDVADVYPVGGTLETVGRTEEIVGEWLAGKRDRFVVATKVYNPMGPGPNDEGNSRRHVIEACDASLRRLQHRLDRPVLHPPLGSRDADRRDARGVRRSAPRREDPLRGLQQHRRPGR